LKKTSGGLFAFAQGEGGERTLPARGVWGKNLAQETVTRSYWATNEAKQHDQKKRESKRWGSGEKRGVTDDARRGEGGGEICSKGPRVKKKRQFRKKLSGGGYGRENHSLGTGEKKKAKTWKL